MQYILLFTPYGYKFEENGHDDWNDGWISEIYKDDGSTGVAWADGTPWKINNSGNIEVNDHVNSVMYGGYLWEKTVTTDFNQSYNLHNYTNGFLYPAAPRNRYYGRSVR